MMSKILNIYIYICCKIYVYNSEFIKCGSINSKVSKTYRHSVWIEKKNYVRCTLNSLRISLGKCELSTSVPIANNKILRNFTIQIFKFTIIIIKLPNDFVCKNFLYLLLKTSHEQDWFNYHTDSIWLLINFVKIDLWRQMQ